MQRSEERGRRGRRGPHLAVVVLAALVVVAPATGTTGRAAAAPTFPDVDATHPFHDEIGWLADHAITTGYPDGGFHPTDPVTRQAMAAFLQRATDPTAPLPACTTAPATDVPADHPFCPHITWLAENAITTGYPDGGFHPTDPVTRQAMAAFLQRASSVVAPPTTATTAPPTTTPTDPSDPCPAGVDRWSAPATWPGGVPTDGEDVVIAAGHVVALDVDTADLGGLTIDGTLVACRTDLHLRAAWILLRGTLRAGTAEAPFTQHLRVTLTATDQGASVMGMGTRGVLVHDGELALHGAAPAVTWTRLGAHAAAGTTTLVLAEPVDWSPGDRIAIAGTDWYGAATTEQRTVASVDGATVELTEPIGTARWGVLQHVTAAGMGLAPDPGVVPPTPDTPLVLDERAEVADLTRPITIEAPDDAAWRDDGFGAHVMVHGLDSAVHVEGVELRRVGQRGRLGRYPLHWHELSYDAAGALLGDATGHVVRSSTVTDSQNRCVTLHATNGVTLQGNVCVDVVGHAVFLEDAVERRNLIEDNLVLHVRNPAYADALKLHEVAYDEGASGFWLSNPDNVVRGNVAADAQGFGFWLAYPQQPAGPSAVVPIRPDRLRFGVFEHSTAHSNGHQGLMLDNPEVDAAGNTFPNQYFSTTDGQDVSWPYDTLRRFTLHAVTTWKNGYGGFWNRATWPTYTQWVSADNEGRFFAGAGAGGRVERSLLVGSSLNSATPQPHPDEAPTAFASYHSSFDLTQNLIVGFPLVPGRRSGAFATDDYYVRPVDKGHARNPGNVLVAAHPGYRSPRPSPSYALAGALWDPHGVWGEAGRYVVYDEPFLTHGSTCSAVAPGPASGGVSCTGPFYGVLRFVLDHGNERWDARFPLEVTRLADDGGVVGTWSVADGNLISAFENMRHFAAHADGRYLLDFPASAVPTDVGLDLENLLTADDSFVLGVRFDGDEPADVFTSSYYNYLDPGYELAPPSGVKHDFVAVGSLAEVVASDGETFWQDAANDVVWLKPVGGLQQLWDPAAVGPFDDETLYHAIHLRIT